MNVALTEIVSRAAADFALFAGVGFLLFAVNDLLVDLIYFGRRMWRSLTVCNRFPRAFANEMPTSSEPGLMAILVPAWGESAVIASMLRATLQRLEHSNDRILVGYYRNDPPTFAAIAGVSDPRIEAVQIEADGPTTKADCLSMKVRNNVGVHFDWRQRLAGDAAPGSGPAITLGADF